MIIKKNKIKDFLANVRNQTVLRNIVTALKMELHVDKNVDVQAARMIKMSSIKKDILNVKKKLLANVQKVNAKRNIANVIQPKRNVETLVVVQGAKTDLLIFNYYHFPLLRFLARIL